jgi:hypothetical protein
MKHGRDYRETFAGNADCQRPPNSKQSRETTEVKDMRLSRPTDQSVNTVPRESNSRLPSFNRLLSSLLATAGMSLTALGADPASNRIVQATQLFRDVTVQPPQVVEDLGDIRPLADRSILRRIRFTTSLYGEFVSNAEAIGNHTSGDFLFIPTVSAALEQQLGHGVSLDFNVRTEAFIYAIYDELSFWGFSGSLLLRYQPTNEWPKFYAGIEPYWYSNIHKGSRGAEIRTGSSISNALAVSAGIDKDWAFNRDQTILFVGYNLSHFFSSPATDNRTSHRFTVGLTQQIRPSLFGQVFYSYQFLDYTDVNRRDSRNFVGMNLVYQFDEHWFTKASTYFVDNNSSQSVASYQTFGIGLAVGYNF